MATELSPACFPVDRVMQGEYLERLPQDWSGDLTFEMRDRSLDEQEEILREESEYWQGMSEVGSEWFFNED